MNVAELDVAISESLEAFGRWVIDESCLWRGKEHDAVNLYAHGFLWPVVRDRGLVADLTQVGIEMGVPQPWKKDGRGAARKDLVIWPRPRMTCWEETDGRYEPSQNPIVVMEWKVRRSRSPWRGRGDDREWLAGFTGADRKALGYAVAVDLTRESWLIYVDRYRCGMADREPVIVLPLTVTPSR